MAQSQEKKNDNAWKKIFEKYHISERISSDGFFIISADEIREFREPRLMAKFDHSINLPDIISSHNLSILPLARGKYIIAPMKAYHQFEADDHNVVFGFSLPPHIQSFAYPPLPRKCTKFKSRLINRKFWYEKISKKVRPIFLVYSNSIFSLYEYKFEEPTIKLVKQKNYSIEDTEFEITDIQNICDTIHTIQEPALPFPQADCFKRVINLCELLSRQEYLTRDAVTKNYAFDAYGCSTISWIIRKN